MAGKVPKQSESTPKLSVEQRIMRAAVSGSGFHLTKDEVHTLAQDDGIRAKARADDDRLLGIDAGTRVRSSARVLSGDRTGSVD